MSFAVPVVLPEVCCHSNQEHTMTSWIFAMMTSYALAWICKYELSYAMCYTVTANPKICKYVMAISIDRLWLLWLCLDCTTCFPQGMQITSGRHNLNILATAYEVYSIVYFKRIQENPRKLQWITEIHQLVYFWELLFHGIKCENICSTKSMFLTDRLVSRVIIRVLVVAIIYSDNHTIMILKRLFSHNVVGGCVPTLSALPPPSSAGEFP